MRYLLHKVCQRHWRHMAHTTASHKPPQTTFTWGRTKQTDGWMYVIALRDSALHHTTRKTAIKSPASTLMTTFISRHWKTHKWYLLQKRYQIDALHVQQSLIQIQVSIQLENLIHWNVSADMRAFALWPPAAYKQLPHYCHLVTEIAKVYEETVWPTALKWAGKLAERNWNWKKREKLLQHFPSDEFQSSHFHAPSKHLFTSDFS